MRRGTFFESTPLRRPSVVSRNVTTDMSLSGAGEGRDGLCVAESDVFRVDAGEAVQEGTLSGGRDEGLLR